MFVVGKCKVQELAAPPSCTSKRHLFNIYNQNNAIRFLIDMGAEVNTIPATPADKMNRSLHAVNATTANLL